MAAIAERIGVSIPAITHHFGSKYGLFMEVIAVSDSIDETRTTRRDAENRNRPPERHSILGPRVDL